MQSLIEKYDVRLLQWLEARFTGIVPDKPLQLLFAPPDRPYAEVTSGVEVGHDMLKKPRIAVARLDYTLAAARQNQTMIRHAGLVGTAGLMVRQVHFPIPIDIPYQLSFWTEYESELQALLVEFFRALYSGVLYLSTFINEIWNNKIISFHLDGSVTNDTTQEPGQDFREIRAVVPLRAEAWLFDEVPTLTPRAREIILRTRDYDSEAVLVQDRVRTPFQIGEGTGVDVTFAFTLPLTPVYKPSIVAFAVCGGVEVRGYDDGAAGVIAGTGVSGTIDYVTGAISLTFAVAPDLGEGVYVEYKQDI